MRKNVLDITIKLSKYPSIETVGIIKEIVSDILEPILDEFINAKCSIKIEREENKDTRVFISCPNTYADLAYKAHELIQARLSEIS